MNIVLASGRTISLGRLKQWHTYAGLLAGLPDRSMNERIIGRVLQEAGQWGVRGCKPVLIEPEIAVREHAGRKLSRGLVLPPRTEERLPAVACIGEFHSGELQRPGSEPFSSAVLVWFQPEIAVPPSAGAIEAIRALDWEACALDWIW